MLATLKRYFTRAFGLTSRSGACAGRAVRSVALLACAITMVSAAHAQQANGLVAGVCKTARFVSDTVVFAVLGLAVTVYGTMYALNAMKEGAMESVVRVSLGGGVAVSAIAIVANIFGTSC